MKNRLGSNYLNPLTLNLYKFLLWRIIMSNKFKNVPVEEDTRILFRKEAKFGKFDVLYEMWSWEGISAESIIFVSDDIADLTDEELEQEIRESPLVQKKSAVTIKRLDEGFTFVNFNFEQS